MPQVVTPDALTLGSQRQVGRTARASSAAGSEECASPSAKVCSRDGDEVLGCRVQAVLQPNVDVPAPAAPRCSVPTWVRLIDPLVTGQLQHLKRSFESWMLEEPAPGAIPAVPSAQWAVVPSSSGRLPAWNLRLGAAGSRGARVRNPPVIGEVSNTGQFLVLACIQPYLNGVA